MRGRIRTIKPEMARSRRLAKVSLTAERTFTQLLPYADDQGRHLDHAGLIQGALWSRRMGVDDLLHTPEDVEEDLRQLAEVGLICRYANPEDDGDLLLHIPTFRKHQVINRPTVSRLAACPIHQGDATAQAQEKPAAKTRKKVAAVTSLASPAPVNLPLPEVTADEHGTPVTDAAGEPSSEQLTEHSVRGSRIPDPGSSTPPGDGCAEPSPRVGDQPPGWPAASEMHPHATGAKALVAEYVASCPYRPTDRFLGHLGAEVRRLLAAGFRTEQIRSGLHLFAANPKSPGALESFVHESHQARKRQIARQYKAWTNPVAGAAAYTGEL
ncbi:hypothetical protein [Kitasatospora sp. NPDC057015]|uniref:hypothetical protein n=1 Tax=Kitasatospora sp. NPDC057015 TaxID=3346001 RepID=UPI0036425ADA